MTAAAEASTAGGPPRSAGRFRLGVVGCGRVFERYYAPALRSHPDWRLVAACDPLAERRAWTLRAFADVSDFACHADLLGQAELDAVLVTPPPPEQLGERALLDDLASHPVDLLCWLFGRCVVRVAARRLRWPSPSDQAIEYELLFQHGLAASCLVSHCRHCCERLEIEMAGRRWLASQSVLLASRRLSMAVLRADAGVRSRSASLIARLLGRPSASVESFSRQLRSFAEYLRAPARANSIADGEAGLRATAALEACRASLASGGRWTDVDVKCEVVP